MKVRRLAVFLTDVWYTWHGLFHVNSDSDTGVCFEKCGPLHSNRGVWHLYINMQPSSWRKQPKMLLSVCGDVASFTSPETLAVCRTKRVAPFTIIQTCRISVWKHGPLFATTDVSVCSSMARCMLTEICGVSAHREKQGAPHQQRYIVSVYKNIASSLTSVVSQQRRAWVTGMQKHSSLHDDRVAASVHTYIKKKSALFTTTTITEMHRQRIEGWSRYLKGDNNISTLKDTSPFSGWKMCTMTVTGFLRACRITRCCARWPESKLAID